ncbi:MAG: IS66 family transposase [Byssovorax sp.]
MRAELGRARGRVVELEAAQELLRAQLREVLKLNELQQADLDRYRAECARLTPNRPERVPSNDLQLAFERVLETFGDPANDAREPSAGASPVGADEANTASGEASSPTPATGSEGEAAATTASGEVPTPATATPEKKPAKRRHPHGRRRLDLTKLPVEIVPIEPDEVMATGGEGFLRIGEEISDRIAFRPASYMRLRLVRGKWVRIEDAETATREIALSGTEDGVSAGAESALACVEDSADTAAEETRSVLVAPLPDSVWPNVMADPSAIAQVILSKYDDVLPLNRQERISLRQGFRLPRSTQCGWLRAAYGVCFRIVDAMFNEAREKAFCLATDATGAPVRAYRACDSWHVFVFIADRDHVVFRYTREHTSDTVAALVGDFRGYLLSDAAPVYDVLHRGGEVIEVACWFHARRYFWRALESDRERALEALAIISELFKISRECSDIPMPGRTEARAERARPVLAIFDQWIERHREQVDPRGPLDKAIGYYENQRSALHRFLDDGRLRLDNISEAQLRNLVLGRHNWQWFANETGLRWYTTFRSLIASAALHGLNAQDYLEQLLRLAPHWPVTRMIELAPKYWAQTIAGLDARHRAILARPWETADAVTEIAAPLVHAA